MRYGTFHPPHAVRLIYCPFKDCAGEHNVTFSQAAVLSTAMTFVKSHQQDDGTGLCKTNGTATKTVVSMAEHKGNMLLDRLLEISLLPEDRPNVVRSWRLKT